MSLARISVTVRSELVGAADRRAGELDRSRSWVVAEALRLYLEGVGSVPTTQARWEMFREAAREPYAVPGLGDQRRAQLEADLALTAEQRVREAEHTAGLSERGWQVDRVLMFDRYEDFLAWERWADLTPP